MRILNLGAGVQSTTILLMSCLGDLPRIDHAIFANTGWERKLTYEHLSWLIEYAKDFGIPIHIVSNGNLRDDQKFATIRGKVADGQRYAALPLFVAGKKSRGMIRRQCTGEYKIKPIKKKIRELLGLKPGQRAGKDVLVEQWFGISADEVSRMRDSRDAWIRFNYPLVFNTDPPMTRQDCLQWLSKHDFPEPPRSACIGCPFHSDYEWRLLKNDSNGEWIDAVEFDSMIRHRDNMKGEAYLHYSLKPLSEIDLRTAEDRGQGNLWINECEGMCGV